MTHGAATARMGPRWEQVAMGGLRSELNSLDKRLHLSTWCGLPSFARVVRFFFFFLPFLGGAGWRITGAGSAGGSAWTSAVGLG